MKDGWVLSVVISHLIADAYTFGMFLNDWSKIYNGQEIEPVQYKIPESVLQTYSNINDMDKDAREVLNMVRNNSSWFKTKLFKMLFHTVMPMILKNDTRVSENEDNGNRLILHYTEKQIQQLKRKKRTNSPLENWKDPSN